MFLKAQGIKVKNAIEYAKTRDEDNRLTEWLNGDRVVFVEKFTDPLPRKTWINDTSVRIFHRDQPTAKPFCTRCQCEGHFKATVLNQKNVLCAKKKVISLVMCVVQRLQNKLINRSPPLLGGLIPSVTFTCVRSVSLA